MAGYLAEASLDLNLNETDDDITAIVLRMRQKQVVNIMIGPPSKEEHDERYLKSFFEEEGYHVICGGTTAQCAARYLGKELVSLSDTACGEVPGYYKLEGAELVTEGFLTIEHLLEYCEEWLDDKLAFNKLKRKKRMQLHCWEFCFSRRLRILIFILVVRLIRIMQSWELRRSVKKKRQKQLVEYLRNAGEECQYCILGYLTESISSYSV